MEGLTERAWRPASSRCSLLGHLRSSCDLADCETIHDPFTYPPMAKPPTRLCHGLSSSPCRNATVHAFTPRILTRRNVTKDPCTQVGAQCVWAKASRPCMEQIHGPGHERNRFQAEFLRWSIVFLVYIDDCIIFGPDGPSIGAVVVDLRACSHQFTIDDQGDIGDFLGIQVQRFPDGSIQLTQPQLIDAIIKDLHLRSGSNTKKTPAVPNNPLHKETDGPDMTPEFHYRSVIGKLNFLEKSTQPDISVSVHQCARFSERPKRSHAEAVKRIGRYLLATKGKGLLIRPKQLKYFECWVDTDFSGNWRPQDAHNDPMTAKSCSGWMVCFAGAPITWASKIQTVTALSTTKAEYIALSTSLREVIPLMGMLKEAVE